MHSRHLTPQSDPPLRLSTAAMDYQLAGPLQGNSSQGPNIQGRIQGGPKAGRGMLKDVGHLGTGEGCDVSSLVLVSIVKLDGKLEQLRGIEEDHVANGLGHKEPEGWQVELP